MLKPNAFLKFLLVLVCFNLTTLFAIDVLVAKVNIKYKEAINTTMLIQKNASKVYRHCVPVTLNDLTKSQFRTKHYLSKGTILCTKDVEIYEKSSVLFDFGSLQIEKDGKIIKDTSQYIKIKKPDGKIEKIYKDGRVQ